MQCETGTREMRIIKKNNTDENLYSVIRCCHKTEEPIYVWSDKDILSMSSEEFMKKLYDGYKILTPEHDYKVYYYCKTKEKECIWNDEYLDTISVSTSVLCNIKCRMCDIISHKKIFPNDKEVYFDILNKIKGQNLETIELTSEGEPFIYKEDTLKYIESLTLNDCKRLEIMTNGVLLKEEDILRIFRAKCNSGIDIRFLCSISGITKESYEAVHKNPHFEHVARNAELINALDMLNCINFVIMPDNLHELDFYKQYWEEKNVPRWKCASSVLQDYNYPGATKIVMESAEYKRFKENP